MIFEPIYIPQALNTGTCIQQGDLFYSAGLHRNQCKPQLTVLGEALEKKTLLNIYMKQKVIPQGNEYNPRHLSLAHFSSSLRNIHYLHTLALVSEYMLSEQQLSAARH